MQGFNVLQINILPQWDRSLPDLGIRPFALDDQGKTDFYIFNKEYFDRAEKMLEMAVERGFVPALVVLWCDYVKDTWASNMLPDHIMPLEAVKPYTEKPFSYSISSQQISLWKKFLKFGWHYQRI